MDTTQDNEKAYEESFKTFYIAGVQFHQMHKVLNFLEVEDILQLTPEPTNEYDPNAVRIEKPRMSGESVMLGYVPRKFSSEVSAAIAIGKHLECRIKTLNKSARPWEQCEVEIKEVV